MTERSTICAHCDRETEVTPPSPDAAIVGKSKDLRHVSTEWESPECDNCNRRFGIRYG